MILLCVIFISFVFGAVMALVSEARLHKQRLRLDDAYKENERLFKKIKANIKETKMSVLDQINDKHILGLARIIAATAHFGQADRQGKAYILHPLAVEQLLINPTIEERIVAILHDTVEDTNLTLNFFRNLLWEGGRGPIFSDVIVDALDAITKREGEADEQYWQRVKQNPIALKVKLMDIKHNTLRERMDALELGIKIYLTNKYRKALKALTGEENA